MRSKLTALALAVAATVAIGAAGVVAADASTGAEDVLPDDYEVDVVDHHDALSDEEADDAVVIAWTNDEVRDAIDDESSVVFKIWARGSSIHGSDVTVWVSGPNETDHASVIAEVALDDGTVVAAHEPTVAASGDLDQIHIEIAGSEDDDGDSFAFEVEDGDDGSSTAASNDDDGDGNATRLTADESFRLDLSEYDLEPRGDGTIEGELVADE